MKCQATLPSNTIVKDATSQEGVHSERLIVEVGEVHHEYLTVFYVWSCGQNVYIELVYHIILAEI